MKKSIVAFLAMVMVFVLAACGSEEDGNSSDSGTGKLDTLKENGVVKIGFANEKPYAFEENGEVTGAAVAIAKEVFKNLGVEEVDGKLAEFSQLIPSLGAGKFDVITAGMAITPDRCENVAFGEPEIMYGEGLIVEKGNPMNLKSYKDIADNPDVKVAVMSGATEKDFMIREGVDEKQITTVPDIPASFSAVESGRAHVTTGTEMTIKMALESADNEKLEFVTDFEQPDIEGVPSYGAAAFLKDDDELREAYNAELKKLKESGKIAELIEPFGFTEQNNTVDMEITTESVCSGDNY